MTKPKVSIPLFEAASLDRRIHTVRGLRVMLDADLAVLYGVRVRNIAEAVNRNRRRFPPDFLLELSSDELPPTPDDLGGVLSTMLQSPQAIEVNIAIVRALATFS